MPMILYAHQEDLGRSLLFRQWRGVVPECSCREYPHVTAGEGRCSQYMRWNNLLTTVIKSNGMGSKEVLGVCEPHGDHGQVLAESVAKEFNQSLRVYMDREESLERIYSSIEQVYMTAGDQIDDGQYMQRSGCSSAVVCYDKLARVGKIFQIGACAFLKINAQGVIVRESNDHTMSNVGEITRLKSITKSIVFHGDGQHSFVNGITSYTRCLGMTGAYGKKSKEICVPETYDITFDPGDFLLLGTSVLISKLKDIAPDFFKNYSGGEFPAQKLLEFAFSEEELGLSVSAEDVGSLHVITTV